MGKKVLQKSEAFYETFYRKPAEDKHSSTYCAGCGHGIVHKLIAEALVDLEMREKTTFISPVGCSVFAYYYFKCGNVQAAHGRAPAVATAVKRAHPESYVICYQGDGDLAAIGTAEIIHAANRGENITVIFVNNAVYGMTGGQMAPTTLIQQKTTTTPEGRNAVLDGMPLKACEIIATMPAPVYVERTSLHDIKHIMKSRLAIRKALQIQKEGKGFSFVEILAQCPTNWKVQPQDATAWMEKHMLPYYSLGVLKDKIHENGSRPVDVLINLKKKRAAPEEIIAKLELKGEEASLDADFSGRIKLDKEVRIKIAGFGGQGVLSLGVFLCQLALRNAYKATWFPSYGPAMRGGTANCSVVLSHKEIASPVFNKSHIIVAMSQPAFDKFHKAVYPGGYIFYNSDVIQIEQTTLEELEQAGIHLFAINASTLAEKAGLANSANVVILGRLLAAIPYFSPEDVFSLLEDKFKSKTSIAELNKKAFTLGADSSTL